MTSFMINFVYIISFFIKIYLFNVLKDYLFLLIDRTDKILKNYTRSDDKNNHLTNVVFVFGILYGTICNYINKVNLL